MAHSDDCYHYTVGSLLHDAGRYRRHGGCDSAGSYCEFENDHVIELRLVVAALNELRKCTYHHRQWQSLLVDFFNQEDTNSQCISHADHQEKTRVVGKWLNGECLSDDEMYWIYQVRDVWKAIRDELRGFRQFKGELNTLLCIYYDFTVGSLLHEAGRHRRHGGCCGGPNCECENDHVIELRLVVAALNELEEGTYYEPGWKTKLVDFFNKKHQNSKYLSHEDHEQKTRAVDKWLDGKYLFRNEIVWIYEIRDVWRASRNQLTGFDEFEEELTAILSNNRGNMN